MRFVMTMFKNPQEEQSKLQRQLERQLADIENNTSINDAAKLKSSFDALRNAAPTAGLRV